MQATLKREMTAVEFEKFVSLEEGKIRGHYHYGGDADVRLQRPPIFSAAVTQWPHIFADRLCCHPLKDPTLFGEMWASIALTQRPPIRLPQEAFFLFQFHRQIDHFCHFRRFFFFKFLLLKHVKRSLKDQK